MTAKQNLLKEANQIKEIARFMLFEHSDIYYHNMSNAQKITAQLVACEQAVMDAYHNQQASIIIVHGIGAGKLKEEVHRLLKSMKKQVRQFENKYSQKYGFGATEVFLRY